VVRRLLALFVALGLALSTAFESSAAVRGRGKATPSVLGVGPLSETSWLVGGLSRGQTFELTPEPWRGLLERYLEPYRNHTPDWRSFWRGSYGPASKSWLPELCWSQAGCESAEPASPPPSFLPAFEPAEALELRAPAPLPFLPWDAPWAPSLGHAPEPELLAVAKRRPCPRWRAPRPVTLLRYAGESERLPLTDCDGALNTTALDALSVLARPAGAPRPALPLPIDPEGDAGEWTHEVRLLHPRLAWAVSEIARAFPGRAIVLMSGYRRDGHSGLHGKGQALDLYVSGVKNEDLFGFCRTLRDAGCGFYPSNRFVHVDVRPYGTGHVAWVDVSAPGEPSVYADGWPGVLKAGVAWLGGG
jgi:hypothetical protein